MNVSAGAAMSAAREVEIGRLPPTTATANVFASLNAQADLQWINPSYAFATPVLGGQLTLGMATAVGWQSANLSGMVNITAPSLPPFTRSDSINSSVTGFGDLYLQATLRWNSGVNNFMIYGTGDIPVGAYKSTRLANLGIGHGAADGGAGYTYLNPAKGQEFSAVAGLTYNLENLSTNYQNGVDCPPRLGSLAVFVQAGFYRPGRLCLRSAVVRQRLRRPRWVFRVARHRHRPADRVSFSGRQNAGLSQFQGLRGIRRRCTTFRLECVGLVRTLADCRCSNHALSDGLQMNDLVAIPHSWQNRRTAVLSRTRHCHG